MEGNYQDKGLRHPNNEIEVGVNDWLEDIVLDIVRDKFVKQSHVLDKLLNDAQRPLYIGYTNFIQLLIVL